MNVAYHIVVMITSDGIMLATDRYGLQSNYGKTRARLDGSVLIGYVLMNQC